MKSDRADSKSFHLSEREKSGEEETHLDAKEMAGEGDGRLNKKVMVAIDENECSRYALEWTLDNLRNSLPESSPPLVVYTAQPLSNLIYVSAATYGSAPVDLIRSLQEQQQKVSLALLEHAKEICSKRGVVVETITEVGDPKEAICEAVEKFKIGMLVLGSHGRGALKRAFLGSVSNHCAQTAKCPVLVVKKTE